MKETTAASWDWASASCSRARRASLLADHPVLLPPLHGLDEPHHLAAAAAETVPIVPLPLPAIAAAGLLCVRRNQTYLTNERAVRFFSQLGSTRQSTQTAKNKQKGNGMAHRAKEISVWSHRNERTF